MWSCAGTFFNASMLTGVSISKPWLTLFLQEPTLRPGVEPMLLKDVAVCGVVQTNDGVCSVVMGVSISKLYMPHTLTARIILTTRG